MTTSVHEAAKAVSRKRPVAEALFFALIVGSVWLGWEIVKAPVMDRAPPTISIRLASGSPEVLRRAAEQALVQDAPADAAALARRSLAAAPFNARALRVLGLATARQGNEVAANEMLTLAGNWSLRDDPAHAWLVEYRLRQGDYGSAFAHADTLVRRRPDAQDAVFQLFTVAAATDTRSLRPLASLLAANPGWRPDYFAYLRAKPERINALLLVTATMQQTAKPLTSAELQLIYESWMAAGQFPAVRRIREITRKPSIDRRLQNGDWEEPEEAAIRPFAWQFGSGVGLTVVVTEDEERAGNHLLRAIFDGYRQTTLAQQTLALAPGRYLLTGEERTEPGANSGSATWSVTCLDTSAVASSPMLLPEASPEAPSRSPWRRFALRVEIPSSGCLLQKLALIPRSSNDRVRATTSFDNLEIRQY